MSRSKTSHPLFSQLQRIGHLFRILIVYHSVVGAFGLAQPSPPTGWQGQLEVGSWVSTGFTQPFWLRANQWGSVPLTTPSGTLRIGLWKSYAQIDTARTARQRRFDWTLGATIVGNTANVDQVLLPEVYGKVRWKSVELSVGRWRQLTGLGDSSLSSGFINGSGNAVPIPKIQLATLGYVPLRFSKNWLALNAGYSHGWFTGAYIQGSYLHQKYVYLRMGKPTGSLKVYLGVNHQVQWAGQADYLKRSLLAVDGKLPSRFKYYPAVVLGLRPHDAQTSDYSSFDGTYWFGNSLGSEDIGLELTTRNSTWLLYHQHIYEDLSGLLGVNVPDGLTGVSWHRAAYAPMDWINRVLLEFLSTMSQSGSLFDPTSGYQGRDNYFNHEQYQQGWSYLGRSIGTPFIGPQAELQSSAQGMQFFPDNRLKMVHLGADGLLGASLAWTLRFSLSQHYGTYNLAYSIPYGQLSSLASIRWQMPGLAKTHLTASLAIDQGDLLPNSLGGYLGLKRSW